MPALLICLAARRSVLDCLVCLDLRCLPFGFGLGIDLSCKKKKKEEEEEEEQ